MLRRNPGLLVLLATLLLSCGEPDPGRSRLKLHSTPGSEVFLDGKLVGETPQDLRLAPGHYEVVFKREGFEDHRSSFPLPANAEVEITAKLVAAGGSDELLSELRAVSVDLRAFFTDLGARPPGALAELVGLAGSGKVPTPGADLARCGRLLGALADAIEEIGTDDALAARARALMDRLD